MRLLTFPARCEPDAGGGTLRSVLVLSCARARCAPVSALPLLRVWGARGREEEASPVESWNAEHAVEHAERRKHHEHLAVHRGVSLELRHAEPHACSLPRCTRLTEGPWPLLATSAAVAPLGSAHLSAQAKLPRRRPGGRGRETCASTGASSRSDREWAECSPLCSAAGPAVAPTEAELQKVSPRADTRGAAYDTRGSRVLEIGYKTLPIFERRFTRIGNLRWAPHSHTHRMAMADTGSWMHAALANKP